jgi:hypothetical protein
MAQKLRYATEAYNEKPYLKFFNTCLGCISTLPNLQADSKNPDDVDTTQDDHLADTLRYLVLEAEASVKKSVVVGI